MTRLLLCCLVIFLGGCSFFSKDEGEPPAPLIAIKPLLTPTILWTAHLGDEIGETQLRLLLAGNAGKLFTTTPTGEVQALAIKNGQRLWQREIEMEISGGVGSSENLVLLGGKHGEMFALSQQDGTEQWRAQVSSEILAVPQSDKNIVVVRTADSKIIALSAQEGRLLWEYSQSVPLLTLRGTSNPLLVDNKVIAGFDNGKLVALELLSGKLLWEVPVAIPHGRTELERMVDIDADLKTAGDVVYAVSFQGRMVAVTLSTGHVLWGRDLSSYAGIAIDEKAVYISDADSYLWALDRSTGASLWKQEKLRARQITAPVVVGDYVVVGDGEGYLHWLRRSDGQFAARYAVGNSRILVAPLHVEDRLIVYDSDGKIVALQAK